MDHEDFRRFEQLAQSLHFARAAQQLGMSASALTRRVQAMEEEVGAQLFQRDQRNVALTQAGEKFRRFARGELERWEEMLGELRAESTSPTGELHIACTVTACLTVLPRVLSLCRERHPGLTLRLVTQDGARSLTQLEAGEVDIAVVPTDGPPPAHLVSHVLASTKFAFIAPADPASFERLALDERLDGAEFVAPLGGLERRRLEEWFERNGVVPRIVAEVRGNEGILAMVSMGSGVGLVPELVLEKSPLPVRVLSHVTPPGGYDVSLCARKKSLGREAVRAFFRVAEEAVSHSYRSSI